MGLSREEYWSGLQFPPLGDLPNAGIEPGSALQADFLLAEPPGKFILTACSIYITRLREKARMGLTQASCASRENGQSMHFNPVC